MKYWIVVNRQPAGPYELSDLESLDLRDDTPVWHEGLPDWMPARDVAVINEILIRRRHSDGQPDVTVISDCDESVKIDLGTHGDRSQSSAERPSNYLAWSIVVTLLCFVPSGVVAIIYSGMVNSRFDRGDIAGARKASEYAQWWIIISIVVGLIFVPFQVLIAML